MCALFAMRNLAVVTAWRISRHFYESKKGDLKMQQQTHVNFLTNLSNLTAPAIHNYNRKIHILGSLTNVNQKPTNPTCKQCRKRGASFYCEGCSDVNMYFHANCASEYHKRLKSTPK